MRKIFLCAVLLCSSVLFGQPNYSFSSSSGTFTALSGGTAFVWNTATANDEEYSSATNIGFTFTYDGTAYTQFQVSTNGFLQFGSSLAAATLTDALNGALRNVLAPLWDDLAVGTTATDITYNLDVSGGSGQYILTVEWKNVKWNKTAGAANAEFQIKLYESDGHIEYVYGTMGTPTAGAASIGLNDATASGTWGTFQSINVGGSGTNFHVSMVYVFNTIANAPVSNTVFTFTQQAVTQMSGTYTVGGSSPNFATLSQAAQALNLNGVNGAVTMNVRSGTYDDIIHLINIAGTSATNTITIKNESGTVTVSPMNGFKAGTSSTATDVIVALLGTDYTTLDGINLTDNASNSTNTTRYDWGYFITNYSGTDGATNNTIMNTTITMNKNQTNGRGVRESGGGFTAVTAQSGANSNNTIKNITTKDTYIGILFSGNSATFRDTNNVVTATNGYNTGSNTVGYNDIGNISITTGVNADFRGVYGDAQASFKVENTEVRNMIGQATASTASNNIYGVFFNTSTTGAVIQNCNLYNLSNGSTAANATNVWGINAAVYTTLTISNCKIYNIYHGTINTVASGSVRGIAATSTTGTNVYITNNMVYDLKAPQNATTTICGVRGIDLQNNQNFYVYNNTVYLDNTTAPSVSGTNVGHNSTSLQIGALTTGNVYLVNNIFVNKMGTSFTGTGFSRANVIYTGSAANTSRIASGTDNNLYYVDNATKTGSAVRVLLNPGSIGSSYLTLSDLVSSTNNSVVYSPRDVNSIFADASTSFTSNVSPYDLHIASTNWTVNGQGLPNAVVTTDIDGNARSASLAAGPVDIGADEYTPTGSASTTESGTIGDGNTTTYTGVDGKTVAQITWAAGSGTLPSSVSVTYKPGAQASGTVNPSIYRNYTITETGGVTGWNADVKFYYNASTELKGYTESSMRINKYNNNWNVLSTTINTSSHYGQANVTSFSDFSFDDGTNALPVELTSFTATVKGKSIELKWSTATETNNHGFDVERSVNGVWSKIDFVQGAGTTSAPKEYGYTDAVNNGGRFSYRLKQIDNSGKFTYNNAIEVVITLEANAYELAQNFPNPFNPVTTIRFSVKQLEQTSVKVYDITGKEVAELFNGVAAPGQIYNVQFNGSGLASGLYLYVLQTPSAREVKKMTLLK